MNRPLPHPERRPVVVAGASSGIGAATATVLAAAGFPVALGARRTDRCDEVADAIRRAGGEVVVHHLDVADGESVEKFAAAVEADLGDVEVVVANAALTWPGVAHELRTEDLEAMVQVNVLGAHRLATTFVPEMVSRRRGDIVFVSSDVVQTLRPRLAGYVATKWAVDGLVQTMQRELEGTGVRASLVRPGPTASEMGFDWPQAETEKVINDWVGWGLARHGAVLPAEAIGYAVHTIVSAPRGTHVTAIDVQPEAPVEKDLEES
jgi:NADP-dependent 3-hydroxy acid dehydrogenase YdfG